MLKDSRKDLWFAFLLIAPFVAIYGLIFIYPVINMFIMSFTDAPLIGSGEWVGLKNYERFFRDKLLATALWNTGYFILLSVVPGTAIALFISLGINRLKGRLQAAVLSLFFLPYVLPVTVVYYLWDWLFNFQFGIIMHILDFFSLPRVPVFKTMTWFMPATAWVTIWWTAGLSLLLFLAGLRAIPQDIYEAAALDNASRWQVFSKITWPLLWPITTLVFTIQLILQLKIFDQVYLFARGGRSNETIVMVQHVFEQAFVHDKGGRAAAIAVLFFAIVIVVTILQFMLLRLAGSRKPK